MWPEYLLSQLEHHVPALNFSLVYLLANCSAICAKVSRVKFGGVRGFHSSLTGQRTGPVGWTGEIRKTQKHYKGFPDTDGSASQSHSWGALYKSLSPFRIFPVQCCWIILPNKSLSKCSKKAEQMQLLLDANSENKLKTTLRSHII